MEISYSVLSGVSKMVFSLSKESPLKKAAKAEYKLALYDLECAKSEANYREGLNRALTHMESAYALYVPTISTWDIFDRDKVLWDKYTYANSICVNIAIIHYILGNNVVAKKWLLEKLNTMGSVYFPDEILDELTIPDKETFFLNVCQSQYYKLESIIKQSESNWDRTFNTWEDPNPAWTHYDGW